MKDPRSYPFEMRTLTEEEGGGYLVSFPDFNDCIADGETVEEAIAEGYEALSAVIATLEEKGHEVPEPGSYGAYSGKYVQRLPRSVHARLQAAARREGVSINTLATTYIVEGLARKAG
jgi:antitoxin HicB